MNPTIDPVLNRFHAALAELYGATLDRVILFGSRAGGVADAQSDYDVAVFLKGVGDLMPEFNRLADLRTRFLDQEGVFFDAIPFPASAYDVRTPIMHEIRRTGLSL